MKKYYFITFQYSYDGIWHTPQNRVSDVHPLDCLRQMREADTKRHEKHVLLFWDEITKSQYDEWQNILN